jgi:DNA-binding NarL/FixJ family response regulator
MVDHGHIMQLLHMLGRFNPRGTKFILQGALSSLLLSKKQVVILAYLILGYSASDIALRLHRSKRTIESHIEDLKDKLKCNSKAELIARVIVSSLFHRKD